MNVTDICARCCVNADSRTRIEARWTNSDGLTQIEFCPCPTSPVQMIAWGRNIRLENTDAKFTLDTYATVITPVATWYGDPVCAYHLWSLVQHERNERKEW